VAFHDPNVSSLKHVATGRKSQGFNDGLMYRRAFFLGFALFSNASELAARDRPQGPSPMVFLSPAGEPFRTIGGDYPSRAWFEQADTNHDGRLSPQEMIADGDRFFRTLDVNGDGLIAGGEIKRYELDIAPEISLGTSLQMGPPSGGMSGMPPGGPPGGDMPGPDGMPSGMPGGVPPNSAARGGSPRPRDLSSMPRGGGLYSLFNVPHPILRADVDVSFSVSRDELRKWISKQFFALDETRKGHLLLSDLPKTPIQRMGSRRRKMPR